MMQLTVVDEGYIPEPNSRERDTGNRPRAFGDYEREWERCTEAAKKLFVSLVRKRLEIGRLASSVCDIKHGGGGHWSGYKGMKTLKDFSFETGICYKTLNTYTRVYKSVYSHIPEEHWDERNWGAALRTLRQVEKNKIKGDAVAEVYDKEKKRSGSPSRLERVIKILKQVNNHLKVIDPEKCEQHEWNEMVDLIGNMAEVSGVLETPYEPMLEIDAEVDDPLWLNDHSYFSMEKMLRSRLMIQAASGGGKSHTIRKIAEQICGMDSQIIFDTEDEFSNFAEKYPEYALIYDEDIDLIEAMEKGWTVIINLSDLEIHERRIAVRDHLDQIMAVPKGELPPTYIVLDEAQIYAPQRGHKTGWEKDERTSCDAVIDVACRGRKRNVCLIVATQRISKLHKDVAAECLNKMIGRTTLDLDLKRSCDELQIPHKRMTELRNLSPGEFFTFGPALGDEVDKVKVGAMETKHE